MTGCLTFVPIFRNAPRFKMGLPKRYQLRSQLQKDQLQSQLQKEHEQLDEKALRCVNDMFRPVCRMIIESAYILDISCFDLKFQ